ncbi:hypothetical protein GCM10022243_37440 [Saccharothrix violaceirubra]
MGGPCVAAGIALHGSSGVEPKGVLAMRVSCVRIAIASCTLVAAALVAPALPASARAETVRWVAMGDAYTAGGIAAAGAEVVDGGLRDGCDRTAGSYPEVLRRMWADRYELVNVSCVGATIANVVSERQWPIGRESPFFGIADPDFPFPSVPAQMRALTPDTDLVTVGIGGNTLGFMEFVYACVVMGQWSDPETASPCAEHFTSGWDGVPTITDRLAVLAEQYGDMLMAIRAAAPQATVLAVGYPAIFPADPADCTVGQTPGGLLHFGTVTRPDLAWLRTAVVEPLNGVIAEQAAVHGVTFVDLYPAGIGHDACRPDGCDWVEGIRDETGEWALVRPNSAGHLAAAITIGAVLDAGQG